MNSFLLIDNAMLTACDTEAIGAGARPDWLACVYEDAAVSVSPHLIDIAAADEAGQCDLMMALVNATQAKLYLSCLDTSLSLAALAQHLRHFIMVRTENGKHLTLRFADCAALPALAAIFTPEQWTALAWPMARWHVHGYDGKLMMLPGAETTATRATVPLVLTEQQLTGLQDAVMPNQVLANLRAMRHGAALPGSTADQHRWASASRCFWRDAGNADAIVLRWLTSAALDTDGAVLQQEPIRALLAQSDIEAIRSWLHVAVAEHLARTDRPGEPQ
ncbi:MAG: DUF4123 domain-containing protein [Pseudomonadota bacterium]|nr:DUF4123 domain-containing protein [Pseudomonadota bacterium]